MEKSYPQDFKDFIVYNKKMPEEKILTQINPEEIAKKGEEIYQRKFKGQYEPNFNGKFLVIEIGSEEGFLGNTSAQALEKAKEKYPQKIFYIKKIGFPAAEVVFSYLPRKLTHGRLF